MSSSGVHSHDTSTHVHAGVDHLASDIATAAQLLVRLDRMLMAALGTSAGDIVRVGTERGRSLLVRLGEPLDADMGRGVVRLDRFARQALKAHLNDEVELERAPQKPAKAPSERRSTAHRPKPCVPQSWRIRARDAAASARSWTCPSPM